MHVLVVLTETPSRGAALCFAKQTTAKTDGSQTLLAVSSESEGVDNLQQTLSATLSPEEKSALKIRSGNFHQQVLAEIQDGDYDLTIIGADLSPPEDSPHVTPAAHLARLVETPLAIVRSCPQHWERTLICSRSVDSSLPTVRGGQEFARRFGIESTILHVIPPSSGVQESAPDIAETTQVRRGPVIQEIQREIDRGAYDLVVVGPHSVPPTSVEPGLTLARPDITRQIIQLAPPVVIVIGQPAIPEKKPSSALWSAELGRIIRSVAIELLIYAVLVVLYALVAFHFLGPQLATLFKRNLPLYAIVTLVLIIGQGVLLEQLTSFLLNRLRLERFD